MSRRIEDAVFDDPTHVAPLLTGDLGERYSVTSYRSAAAILAQRAPEELAAILRVLGAFRISADEIRAPGGNRMSATSRFAALVRAEGFEEEARIEADLVVKLRAGKGDRAREIGRVTRSDYIHNHLVDFWRGRVAFDYEWNSKDQTYDRDLYAFRSFFEAGVIDVGVIVTRELDHAFFQSLGFALDKDGNPTGSRVADKFGASTTGTHKLISRIAAGRSGGCPVLVFGIRPGNVTDAPVPQQAEAGERLL